MQHGDEDATPGDGPKVLNLRGELVMLAADVARAFDIETREMVQAIRRNPQKFTERQSSRRSSP